MYHTILGGGIAEVGDATSDRSSFGPGQIRCVDLENDLHLGFLVHNSVVGVCCSILKKANSLLLDGLCGECLLR